jgi:DNA-directed RNA polymerase specialized sigma24 family protein
VGEALPTPTFGSVDALDDLPETYATALRLREAGCSDEMIADRLDIVPEAVAPLLRIALAKLTRSAEAEENA